MDLTPGPEGPRRESWLPVADQASLFLEEQEAEIVGVSVEMLAEIQAKARDEGYRAGREDAARDIEVWVKRERDSYRGRETGTRRPSMEAFDALDELLHDFARNGINLGRSAGSDPKDTSSGTEVER